MQGWLKDRRNQGLNPNDLQRQPKSFLNRRSVFLLSPQPVENKDVIAFYFVSKNSTSS